MLGSAALAAACAIGISAGMILLTSALHRSASTISSALESVRFAEEAQADLLLLDRTDDPLMRTRLAAALSSNIANARPFVSSGEEAKAYQEAESRVAAYLAGVQGDARAGELDKAFEALSALVEANLADARHERQHIARLDTLANGIGISSAVAFLAAVAVFGAWFRVQAMRPLLALAGAMSSFARGNRFARATPVGAAELAEMASEFNQMADALAARRQEQMALLAGVAHDLRNPLAAIGTASATLRADRPLPPEPAVRRSFATVQGQVRRLDRLVSDLLDNSVMDSGKLTLDLAPCDLRRLVRSVYDLYEGTFPDGVRLSLEADDEPVSVRCDAPRMERVLSNLISNALKYSPEGSPVVITVTSSSREGAIEISDRGIGISAEDLPHIFEPFRRATTGVPGLGLGLFVAKRIVDAHGGRLEVESAVGRGSRFTVRLPLGGSSARAGP